MSDFKPPPPLFDKQVDNQSATRHAHQQQQQQRQHQSVPAAIAGQPMLPRSASETSDSSRSNASPTTRDADRLLKYQAFLKGTHLDEGRLKELARAGIPDAIRGQYWKILIGYLPLKTAGWAKVRSDNAKMYHGFAKDIIMDTGDAESQQQQQPPPPPAEPRVEEGEEEVPVTLGHDEGSLPKKTSDTKKEEKKGFTESREDVKKNIERIDVDIPRTIPSIQFFATEELKLKHGIPTEFTPSQMCLRRILRVYAQLNPGIGYVQGMNELVGHFLFAFSRADPEHIEEVEPDVFFCFQLLMRHAQDNFIRTLDFDKGSGVSSSLLCFNNLLYMADHQVHEFLVELDLKPEFFAFRWITLLLSQEFVLPDVLRIWDYLFSFGDDVMSAVCFVAVAMIIYVRTQLLEMGFGQAMQFLQQYPSHVDVGQILELSEVLIGKFGLEIVPHLKAMDTAEVDQWMRENRLKDPSGVSLESQLKGLLDKMKGSFHAKK